MGDLVGEDAWGVERDVGRRMKGRGGGSRGGGETHRVVVKGRRDTRGGGG